MTTLRSQVCFSVLFFSSVTLNMLFLSSLSSLARPEQQSSVQKPPRDATHAGSIVERGCPWEAGLCGTVTSLLCWSELGAPLKIED